ncbi:MAG TPA: amino acid ABC transporter permease [Nocardioidaceae bacterium]|jgi:glutamate transport system permease protein|nr:amino acid ABC transporter permease [Nocardioidaceae bacterium]
MSTANRVLFDAPGPRGRRRIKTMTVASVVVLAIIVAAALKQLGDHGQLQAYRWQAFTTVPYLRVLGEGLWGTLKATGMSAVLAFPLGALLALMRLSTRRPVRVLAVGYIEVFRSIPLLLLIYAFLLALPRYGVNLPVFWKLVVPIVMVMSAIIAEVVRAGILALDRGQSEAAEAIGFRYWQAMRLVILPQATRLVLPSLIAQLVTVLKESTLGYAVSYPELMKQGDFLTARTHLLFQTFVIVAVIYVVINFLLGRLAGWVERRLSRRPGGAGPRATQETQLANAPNAGLAPTA